LCCWYSRACPTRTIVDTCVNVLSLSLARGVERSLGVHQESNDQTVKTQDFGENENKNHADEEPRLLSSTTDTSITNNTNSETSSKTGETDGETSTELDEASVKSVLVLLEGIGNQDGDDETVDTNDTSHNDGNNVLDDEIRAEDTHGSDTNTGLGSTVRGTKAGEDDGCCAAHGTKEGRVNRAKIGHCKCVLLREAVSKRLRKEDCGTECRVVVWDDVVLLGRVGTRDQW